MNKVILMGRLTADPEIRKGENGNVARYTLAVDRMRQTPEAAADFIRCVAFDKGADFAEKYLTKGVKIAVEGRIRTGSYTNREGQKVSTTDVVIDRHEFAESKKAAQPEPQMSEAEYREKYSATAQLKEFVANMKGQTEAEAEGFMPVDESELPFN